MVHGYGLAASQLARVRSHGVKLTVAVDKVAASGGYLMAAVADRILAAPFAVLGSIGVVAQIPNVHRLLKKHDVDVEVLTAGRHKRTLDMLGENTEQGRAKFREELEDVHVLFQEYVGRWRPSLDLDAVATGEAWYGQRALERALVDELITSDEYLARACEDADVFEVSWGDAEASHRTLGRPGGRRRRQGRRPRAWRLGRLARQIDKERNPMTSFRAFRVEKTEDRQFPRSVVELDSAGLPLANCLIDVAYSSLNYKDALSATGNPA